MNRSYTPNLIEVLRATMQNVEQTSGIQPDDPPVLELRAILDRRVADLEREMASALAQAASEPVRADVHQDSDWEMAS
jgi:hypothetical protein